MGVREGRATNLGIAISIRHLCPTLKQELDEIKVSWWCAGQGRGRERCVSRITRVGERREGDGSKTRLQWVLGWVTLQRNAIGRGETRSHMRRIDVR